MSEKVFPDEVLRWPGPEFVKLVRQIERGPFTLRVWENSLSGRRGYWLYGSKATPLVNGLMVDWNATGAMRHDGYLMAAGGPFRLGDRWRSRYA